MRFLSSVLQFIPQMVVCIKTKHVNNFSLPKDFFGYAAYSSGSPSVVSDSTTSASPGNLLEMQILGPQARSNKPETLRGDMSRLCLNKLSRVTLMYNKF